MRTDREDIAKRKMKVRTVQSSREEVQPLPPLSSTFFLLQHFLPRPPCPAPPCLTTTQIHGDGGWGGGGGNQEAGVRGKSKIKREGGHMAHLAKKGKS